MTWVSIVPKPYFLDYGGEITGKQPFYVDYMRDLTLSRRFQHTFCGAHQVEGAWCPNENKPLLQLLSLDTSDPRLSLQDSPFSSIPLFYCWTCAVSHHDQVSDIFFMAPEIQEAVKTHNGQRAWCAGGEDPLLSGVMIWEYGAPFYYQISTTKSIALLQYGLGMTEPHFPYPDYPLSFPRAPAVLLEVNSEVQEFIKKMNVGDPELDELTEDDFPLGEININVPHHQVGGEPYVLQGSDYVMRCPICIEQMPFLASIANDCPDPRGIIGDDEVQVVYHYCKGCRVVGAFNLCA